MYNLPTTIKLINHKYQGWGAGAGRSRPFYQKSRSRKKSPAPALKNTWFLFKSFSNTESNDH